MEIEQLDLSETVCPMALILAKRAAAKLQPGHAIRILVSDAGSVSDIPRYFLGKGYQVSTRQSGTLTEFLVTR